jgi:hypothetical protein
MPTVDVADVRVVLRKVEIESRCPGCAADLRVDRALLIWRFRDEMLRARLPCDGEHGTNSEGGVVVSGVMPEGGETFVDGICVLCSICDHVLAEGAFESIQT